MGLVRTHAGSHLCIIACAFEKFTLTVQGCLGSHLRCEERGQQTQNNFTVEEFLWQACHGSLICGVDCLGSYGVTVAEWSLSCNEPYTVIQSDRGICPQSATSYTNIRVYKFRRIPHRCHLVSSSVLFRRLELNFQRHLNIIIYKWIMHSKSFLKQWQSTTRTSWSSNFPKGKYILYNQVR